MLLAKLPFPSGNAKGEEEQKQTKRTKSFTGFVTLVGFCNVGLPRFPTAPTAHTEKAQANGLGIGHNNRSKGLKARHMGRVPDCREDDAGPSALGSFQCPISWGGTPVWYGSHLWCW